VRLFLAIELPGRLRSRLEQLQEELQGMDWELRFSPPEKLHLSLHFLGETPDNLLEDLHHDLGALCHARRPFDLGVGGLGAFPNWADPRVVWAGVHDKAGSWRGLFEASFRILRGYRIFDLRREFSPHLTLARIGALKASWDPRRIQGLMPQWGDLGILPVQQLALMRSQPGEGGSVYRTLQTYPLTGS
jgi:2'-5' RNA ligase